MDVQDKRDSRWSSMSDEELAANELVYRAQVDLGLNDGCREYLIAVVCEQHARLIAEARRMMDIYTPGCGIRGSEVAA